jgi:hypothetical protein
MHIYSDIKTIVVVIILFILRSVSFIVCVCM